MAHDYVEPRMRVRVEGPDRELTVWLRDTTGLPIGTTGDESPADSFSPPGSRADRADGGGLLQYFFELE